MELQYLLNELRRCGSQGLCMA